MPRPSPSVRYGFDEYNRLVTTTRVGRRLTTAQISETLLRIDRANRLIVETAARGGERARTLILDGAWSLTPEHRLALTARRTAAHAQQTLALSGALAKAEAHQLVLSLRRSDGAGGPADLLALSGRWQADRQNRLSFLVRRGQGAEDRLTLQGAWELGRDHALLYRYRQQAAGAPAREQVLRFDGAWDLPSPARLFYRLEGSDRSGFAFSARLRQAGWRRGRGTLEAEVRILGRGERARRRIVLAGAWSIRPDLSIAFEVPYAGGRAQAMTFEGAYAVTPRNRIAIGLQTRRREPLGLTLTVSRALAPHAQAFLELRRDGVERAAIGGVQVKF